MPSDPSAVFSWSAPSPVDPRAVYAWEVPSPADPRTVFSMPAPEPADPRTVFTMPAPEPADPRTVFTWSVPSPPAPDAVFAVPSASPADPLAVYGWSDPSPSAPGAVFSAVEASPAAPLAIASWSDPTAGAPSEVFAVATVTPGAPGEVFFEPEALTWDGVLEVSGTITPAVGGLLLPAPAWATAYAGGQPWTSDGTATPAASGYWVRLYQAYLIVPSSATLAEIAPPAGYTATGSQSTASQVIVQSYPFGTTKIYWLYDVNDGNPATARWVDAADSGMVSQNDTVIAAGQPIYPRTRMTDQTFIGGLGEAWEASEETQWLWFMIPFLNGSSTGQGYWLGMGRSPQHATWSAVSVVTGIPVIAAGSGVAAPGAVFAAPGTLTPTAPSAVFAAASGEPEAPGAVFDTPTVGSELTSVAVAGDLTETLGNMAVEIPDLPEVGTRNGKPDFSYTAGMFGNGWRCSYDGQSWVLEKTGIVFESVSWTGPAGNEATPDLVDWAAATKTNVSGDPVVTLQMAGTVGDPPTVFAAPVACAPAAPSAVSPPEYDLLITGTTPPIAPMFEAGTYDEKPYYSSDGTGIEASTEKDHCFYNGTQWAILLSGGELWHSIPGDEASPDLAGGWIGYNGGSGVVAVTLVN